jgi:hypothetical protein
MKTAWFELETQLPQKIREATKMTLSTLFEKKVFIRLAEDQSAFVCTSKGPLFSSVKRVSINDAMPDFAAQAAELSSMARKDLPMLRNIPPE